ncbi:MAG: alpha/beta fold hydrolase [Dehalococcoidales bacterium]|nr:alpha/beta fold hydrolase [Dehalococcoidales bacterium]
MCNKGENINRIQHNNIKVGGLNVHYLYGGQGEPLVIIHGGGSGINEWQKNMEVLSEHYTVYAPDLPGFGNSQSINERFKLSEYVDFLDSFVDTIGLKRFYLLGHSIGGGITLKFALKSPQKIKSLILVSSMFLGKEIAIWARYLSTPTISRLLGEACISIFRAVGWVIKSFCASYKLSPPFSRVQMSIGTSIMTLKGQTTVLLDQLTELVMPTLLVWGARDGIVPAIHAYAAADVIPDCRIYIFEGCGHNVQKQKLQEFSQLVINFLGRNTEGDN